MARDILVAEIPTVLRADIYAVAALAGALLRRYRGGSISLTDRVPFGAALCLGTWIVWLYGPVGIG